MYRSDLVGLTLLSTYADFERYLAYVCILRRINDIRSISDVRSRHLFDLQVTKNVHNYYLEKKIHHIMKKSPFSKK